MIVSVKSINLFLRGNDMTTQGFCLKKQEVVDNYKIVNYCLHIGIGKCVCKNLTLKQVHRKGNVEIIPLSLLK